MDYRYLPATEEDKKEMLAAIGVTSVEELFSDIPENVRFKREYNIPQAMSETEVERYFGNLAQKNANLTNYTSFLGAGIYQHYIPSIVNHILLRSEFYTAYTPYQPEISQGELQAIFEYQSLICELTGMDVANSSMYDGATALAEACAMAVGHTKRRKVVLPTNIHPEYREVVKTYAKGLGFQVIDLRFSKEGIISLNDLQNLLENDIAAVAVSYPNFFGNLENLKEIAKLVHANKSLLIVVTNPISLGILKPPGEFNADIVVGDGQPFGIPMSLGGPTVGFFATTKELLRKMPGRIVGQTQDEEGNRGFVLTLQAREQHIRREKATSNICSNQALMALAAAITMNALGKKGLQEIAIQNFQKAHYAYNVLSKVNGVEIVFNAPFFNEFVLRLNRPVPEVLGKLLTEKIIGGYNLSKDYPELGNAILIAVTELRTKEEIDSLAKRLEGIL